MTGTPEALKRANMNAVYRALVELGSATRQELTDKTGISLTTIRAVLEELSASGELVELALDASSGGRRAVRYALNGRKNLLLSLYADGGEWVYQVANLAGEVLEQRSQACAVGEAEALVDRLAARWDIRAIGVGGPGVVEGERFLRGCDLEQLAGNDIGARLRERCGVPVVLENELNAIAYGYAAHYLARHEECAGAGVNLAWVHFNRACAGAGIVADGRVVHGAGQFAGELGFLPLEAGKTLDQALDAAGGPEETADVVCRTLAILACVTNPALIVVGGDRFDAGGPSREQIEQKLREQYLPGRICPEIALADAGDFQRDYLFGIKELTLDHVLPLLPFQ